MQKLSCWADRNGFGISPLKNQKTNNEQIYVLLCSPQLLPVWDWISENIQPTASFTDPQPTEEMSNKKYERIKALHTRKLLRQKLAALHDKSSELAAELQNIDRTIRDEYKKIEDIKNSYIFFDSYRIYLNSHISSFPTKAIEPVGCNNTMGPNNDMSIIKRMEKYVLNSLGFEDQYLKESFEEIKADMKNLDPSFVTNCCINLDFKFKDTSEILANIEKAWDRNEMKTASQSKEHIKRIMEIHTLKLEVLKLQSSIKELKSAGVSSNETLDAAITRVALKEMLNFLTAELKNLPNSDSDNSILKFKTLDDLKILYQTLLSELVNLDLL